MAALSTIVAGTLLAGSAVAGNQQRKDSRAAGRAQADIARIQNKQARRDFLNQFRQAQAVNLLGGIAALQGGFESSRIQGGQTSLITQKDIGLSEFDEQARLGERVIAKNIDAAKQGFIGSVLRSGASFAMSAGGGSFLDNLGKGGSSGAALPQFDFQGRPITYD